MLDADSDPQYLMLREAMRDGALQPDSDWATVNNPSYFNPPAGYRLRPTAARNRLHRDWMNAELAKAESTGKLVRGQHAIIMAGPPGAGKGTAQGELGDLAGYVVCDPDVFKEHLLFEELSNGNLDTWGGIPCVRDAAERGAVFAPMHYAALVHEESSYIAKRYQLQVLTERYNIVIDTVLKDQMKAEALLELLEENGYTYEVVSVQTTAEIATASMYQRWKAGYDRFLDPQGDPNDSAERLGGRPVPSSFAKALYPEKGKPSPSEEAAEWLKSASALCTRYRLFRRDETGLGTPERDQPRDGTALQSGQYPRALPPQVEYTAPLDNLLSAESPAEVAQLLADEPA